MLMRATRRLLGHPGVPAFVTLLALFTVASCLMSFMPSADGDAACQGHKLCAQSGPSVPVAVLAQDVARWECTNTSAIWLPIEPVLVADSQRGSTPSAPRAPPPSLA
jgi:hypothetical protein